MQKRFQETLRTTPSPYLWACGNCPFHDLTREDCCKEALIKRDLRFSSPLLLASRYGSAFVLNIKTVYVTVTFVNAA